MAVTKMDLAKRLSAKTGLSRAQALEAVQVVFEAVSDGLASRNEVQLREFGTFKLVHCRPRIRMNVRSRERIMVPEKYRVKFKPASDLRKALLV
jgi:nucleoid DNA-binding protein